ncbi:MAG: hypothetical protein R6V50_06890 [Thermoplasmatota archaeon]
MKQSKLIRSSEINQYLYCPMAWYLQRCGYQPESVVLNEGVKKHVDLGENIDTIQTQIRHSYLYALLSIILFVIVIGSILVEVI